MIKHSLRLNPAEVLELSTSWQEEEQAKAAHAAASRRTGVVLFSILERYGLEQHAALPWRLKSEGDEVLICGETPDPKREKPPKLEGAALCAVEGHLGPSGGLCEREGCEAEIVCTHEWEKDVCRRCGLEGDDYRRSSEYDAYLCEKHGHVWGEPKEHTTGQVCKRCGQVSDEPPVPKKAVGGPGSKLTPAQAKRARRKKTTVKP